MRPPQELCIPLRHLNLAARAWGDRNDPPILALHGWLDNAGSFDRLAPLLEGRYLVALDLAGHGRSDHRAPGSGYPYVDYLDEIAAVIDWMGGVAVDLLGHSLGATLASVFAALSPGKVRRLLLIEGLGPLTLPAERTLEQWRRAHAARQAFTGESLRHFPDLDSAIEARRRAGHLSLEAARCIVARGVRTVEGGGRAGLEAGSGEGALGVGSDRAKNGDGTFGVGSGKVKSGDGTSGFGSANAKSSDGSFGVGSEKAFSAICWSSDPRLTLPSPLRLTEDQLAAVLPGIEASTLLVLAEPEAPYLQRATMDARIALVRDIEVIRIPGTHHLHLEDPLAVAAVINAFLQRESSSARLAR